MGGVYIKPLKRLIATALGQEEPDRVLKNGRIFNVFTGEFMEGDIAIVEGYIAGIGKYRAKEELDMKGFILTPGFIDAHMHIESSMVSPSEFAKAVVPIGTTTVIADPHEIANVLGGEGIQYMLDATEDLPLNVYFMLPSCVPATEFEHAGDQLLAADLATFLDHPRVLGLGEMMDYPGVITGKEEVLAKLALVQGKMIDGHAPGVTGKTLAAYIAAGIQSDHECLTASEAMERLAQGMYIMLREGSAAQNLRSLLAAVTAHTLPQCLLATDDRHPEDLIEFGHINYLIKLSIEAGLDLSWVLKMATINTARYFGLKELGAIATGYRADILAFSDTTTWKPAVVIKDGKVVAREGACLSHNLVRKQQVVTNTICLGPIKKEKLRIPAESTQARVIGLIPRQLVTTLLTLPVPSYKGEFLPDVKQDIIKLAVWERHHGSGNVGVGLLQGFGLRQGAIASTVAHDSHNLIIAGTSDDDMMLALEEIQRLQGGLAIVDSGKVLGSLALPLAGLMTELPVEEVRERLLFLQLLAKKLGIRDGYDPFMTLAFLSLPVIPAAKLTDCGLVDVAQGKILPVSL
ncbi:MAG: adenine deaminase [Sporomusaceae bacterium]|nr:adenine deaminase [Sporomusaceae bacterium]